MNSSGNDDLKQTDDHIGTLATSKKINTKTTDKHFSNNHGKNKNNHKSTKNVDNVDPSADDKTDDFQNDNFVSNNNKQSNAAVSYQVSNSNFVQSTKVDSNNPTANTEGATDDFQNDNFISENNNLSTKVDNLQGNNKNSKFVKDTGTTTDAVDPSIKTGSSTDDFGKDDLVSSNNKQSNVGDDYQMSNKNSNFVQGTGTNVNSNNPTSNTEGATDDFQNDNFISENNNLSTKADNLQGENKNSKFIKDTGSTTDAVDPSVNTGSSTDDFGKDDLVSSNIKLSNVGDDYQMSNENSNFVQGTGTNVNSNNPASNTEGATDDFQNDNFVSQNNNLSTNVDDFQMSNKNSEFVKDTGTMTHSENFVNDTKAGYINSLDDFATGDDTDSVASTVKNSGMVSVEFECSFLPETLSKKVFFCLTSNGVK